MLTDLELINIQTHALFRHDDRSRLLSVNEPGAEPEAPRFFLGRTLEGNIWRFRSDLPESLIEKLERICVNEPISSTLSDAPAGIDEIVTLLKTHGPVRYIESGPAYCFTEYQEPSQHVMALRESDSEMLRGGFEKLMEELPEWQPFVALVENGRAVSVCRSVRITSEAHEAGVETLPDFRGKDLATRVTAVWASLVHSSGAEPLYSTSWDNVASQSVARKLNLKNFGADLHIG